MNKSMRVAVTGGTGYVGRYIVDALLAAGCDVRVLVRNKSEPLGLPAAVEQVVGGLDPDGDYGRFLDGADALVHAAYQHVAGRYRGGEGDDLAGFMRVNVGGSLALLEAARRAGVERCVVFRSHRNSTVQRSCPREYRDFNYDIFGSGRS